MKKLLVMLLIASPAMATPVKLVDEGFSFKLITDTDVAMCVGVNTQCGPLRSLKASADWINCGIGFVKPTGTGLKLACYGDTPGVVIPPVVVIMPPMMGGPVRFADEGQIFSATQDALVYFCVGLNDRCAPRKSVKPGFYYACNIASYTDPAPGIAKFCFGAPMPVEPPTAYSPPSVADIAAGKWKYISIDTTISSYYTRFAVWIDRRTGKVVGQFATLDEAIEVAENYFKKLISTDDEWIAYQASKPVRSLTPTELAFKKATIAEYSPRMVVKPSGTAADAPVYALKADGTRNTTAVKNVRATRGMWCDITKRIGTTSFYKVPSLGEVYSSCALMSPLG